MTQLMERLFDDPHSFLDTHYSNPPQDSPKSFLQLMLTLDSICIYELFLYMCATEKESETLWKNDIIATQFFRDLFLMGNQIPMSFLKAIAEFPNKNEVNLKDLQTVLLDIVVRNCPFPMGNKDWFKNTPNPIFSDCKHLLDCQYVLVTQELHEHRRSPQSQETNQGAGTLTSNHRDRLPTASQLSKVGIRFKACEGNVSVIKYHPMTLHLDLPRIVVYKGMEHVLRNLLAYEQTFKEGGEFTMYAAIIKKI